jgi:hypothetical protein
VAASTMERQRITSPQSLGAISDVSLKTTRNPTKGAWLAG